MGVAFIVRLVLLASHFFLIPFLLLFFHLLESCAIRFSG